MRKTATTKSAAPKFTCSKVLFLGITLLVLRQSWPWFTIKWSLAIATYVTHTKSLISLNCLLAKLLRHHGTEKWFSCGVWPSQKSTSQTHSPTRPSSIKHPKPQFPPLVTHQFSAARQSALIWVAFLFHIWVLIRGGCVCATAQCTISSVAWDRVPPLVTCLTLTTRCGDQYFALRSKFSLTNPAYSSTSE